MTEPDIIQSLERLAGKYGWSSVQSIVPLTAEGSPRHYFRLRSPEGETLVGCYGSDRTENQAFRRLSDHFRSYDMPVPSVFGMSDDGSVYIQDDLGDTSLYDMIAKEGFTDEVKGVMRLAMERLADMQHLGMDRFDFSGCYPREAMDSRSVMWDLNYFKYCFLKAMPVTIDEDALEDDFRSLADEVTSMTDSGSPTMILRDFQSRNVMVRDGEPYFIDFQGARCGPAEYDVASFLWQSRAGIPETLRQEMIESYLDRVRLYDPTLDRDKFIRRLRLMVLFRTLQTLGAYGFRGLYEQKSRFVTSIPLAIDLLRREMPRLPLEHMPHLATILRTLVDLPAYKSQETRDHLIVTVTSFSFKRGIPRDMSGNGGGFVMDCRGLPNPGRYDRYKSLTGMDADVIEFLSEYPEVDDFVEEAIAVTSHSVETYLRRGFTHLMVSFGCTGGRHRSVYCAENYARRLHDRYGVEVRVEHREQGVSYSLKKHAARMKAMIFAAGLGTRLRPLTDRLPKALIDVAGIPAISRVIDSIRNAGISDIVVNLHHHAPLLREYLHNNHPQVRVSDESDMLLDTGGGLVKALRDGLLDDADDVLLCNADVLTDLPLKGLIRAHRSSGSDATLLTSDRDSSRRLLFGSDGRMRGWINVVTGQTRPDGLDASDLQPLAFGGIHIVSRKMLDDLERYASSTRRDVFSIMDYYIDRCSAMRIGAYRPAESFVWFDIGRPETLAQAREHFSRSH